MESLVTYTPGLGVAGLIGALLLYASLTRLPTGTRRMAEIAEAIQDGALAFLKREYSYLFVFIVVVAGLLLWGRGWPTALAFVAGAGCSMLAGAIGMMSAT
ncbi:MAG TPA: sodium/proton-translocating pyrophosphatase, partial [Polyangiaceae bacterium]|nr:sodium/proton-translocating pyrophosphatase [Polyangiaceae bacterium]